MLEWLGNPYDFPFWIFTIALISLIIGIVARPFATYVKFVYPNAKYEAIGNPFLGERELTGMVETKTLTAFIESLNASKDYTISGDDAYAIQKSLDGHFIQTIEMMRQDSTKKLHAFFDVYLEKVDLYHVKNAVKKIVFGKTALIDPEAALLPQTRKMLMQIKEIDKEHLPKLLQSYGFSSDLVEPLVSETLDPFTIDIEVDRYFIAKIAQVPVPYKCEKAKQDYVKRMIDMRNIKTLLRAKQLEYDSETCNKLYLGEGREIATWKYTEIAEVDEVAQVIAALEGTSYFGVLKDAIEEYTREGSVQVLETVLDSLFLKLIKDISLQNYLNIGPTLRFLVSKEVEVQNLKVIAKGLSEQLSVDLIKPLLITEAST